MTPLPSNPSGNAITSSAENSQSSCYSIYLLETAQACIIHR